MVTVRHIESPVGPIILGAAQGRLCLLEFTADGRWTNRTADFAKHFGDVQTGDSPVLDQAERELQEYFAGERKTFDVPIHLAGTEFQMRVWKHLLRIPYGKTASYLEVAAALGDPNATRAVGGANGANRIAIIVPCHRVIAADGSLGGYGGGLPHKQWLLELESAAPQARLL